MGFFDTLLNDVGGLFKEPDKPASTFQQYAPAPPTYPQGNQMPSNFQFAGGDQQLPSTPTPPRYDLLKNMSFNNGPVGNPYPTPPDQGAVAWLPAANLAPQDIIPGSSSHYPLYSAIARMPYQSQPINYQRF
jgi:hypothetical protein